jgi:hypothetical protein
MGNSGGKLRVDPASKLRRIVDHSDTFTWSHSRYPVLLSPNGLETASGNSYR